MTEEGLLDAERRRFNRFALVPSLIVLFVIAGLPALYLLAAIRKGKLRAVKRAAKWNIKRTDIDKWIRTL